MSLPPSKPFYLSVFLKEAELLKHDEYGVYVRLLEYMWKSGSKISHDDIKIAHYLRITAKKWQNYKKILQKFFIFSDQTMSHIELKKEYNNAILKSRHNSLNARKRWDKQRTKTSEEKNDLLSSDETKNYHCTDAIALNSHMRSLCHTRASNRIIRYRNKIDDRFSLPESGDKLAKLTELQTRLIELFSKNNMQLPDDGNLLAKWLEDDIKSDIIYKTIEQIINRIHAQNLDHPKSFFYFHKAITNQK